MTNVDQPTSAPCASTAAYLDAPLPEQADIVVIGAGLVGAAAAWQAAARGFEVLVLEQFEPANEHGSSHGSARIVRRAYLEDDYLRLTGEAFELWREVESRSGRHLLRMTGGIDHGAERTTAAIAAATARLSVPVELIEAAEASGRWPGMRFDGRVLYHPQAGTLDAETAVESLLDLAQRGGVQVRSGTAVESLVPADHFALVHTAAGTVRARRVVVAAGAWTEGLLRALVPLPPLAVTGQRVFHFPRVDEASTWPVTIHHHGLDVFHLPGGRDGGPGDARKIAEHAGRPVDPRERRQGDDPSARQRIVRYVREWLPGLVPTPFAETTCLYTRTPNEDFLIDRVGPLVIVSACSGHGAKFAPVVGRLVTDLATTDAAPLRRFALTSHLG